MAQEAHSPPSPKGPDLDLDRGSVAAACLASVIITGVFTYQNFSELDGLFDASGILIGRDYVVFWSVAILAFEGQLQGLSDLGTFNRLLDEVMGVPVPTYAWLYPPTYIFWILPFGLVPYLWGFFLWISLTLAAYLWALRSLIGGGRWLIPVLILAPSTYMTALLGQNGFLTAALLVGGLALLEKRPILAGVLLGLLSFKPQLGLLLPVALIAAGLWRPFASAAITVVVTILCSIAAFGIDPWIAFWIDSTATQSSMVDENTGAFIKIAVSPLVASKALGLDWGARLAVQLLCSAFAVAAVIFAFRRPCGPELRIALLLVATLLASPYSYHYDLPLLTAALLLAFREGLRGSFLTGERFLLGFVWFLPILVPVFNEIGVPIAPPILLAFAGFLLKRIMNKTALGPETERPGHAYAAN